ncbi:MAG TPA: NfeD family protein [Bacteroidales bacterium]|nr:NfeD family protein [Bacteroidales bacterium]
MKRLFLLLLCFVPLLARGADTCRVYVLTIDSEIHAKSARTLDKALEEAERIKAGVFLMRLNTFGGALDAADRMRTALLEAPFTTVSFIDHQAASAGALISLACDSIYMSPGSTVGSATVVNQTGEPMPEKYQSYMRSLMRATAEETGRDPVLAEQMVNGEKIVSLTTQEAVQIGFSQGQAENISQVVDMMGYAHCEIHEYKETWLDKIIGFFLLPLVQGLLLMGIIGGVFFELKTPGVGFPLGLAVVCAIFYFSPLFLEGMVQYWEAIVLILGVILLFLEIFITPGFGVLGILGIVAVGVGLTFSMIDNWVFEFEGPFPWKSLLTPVAVVSLSGLAAMSTLLFSIHMLFPTRAFNHIALRQDLKTDEGFVGVPVLEGIQIGQEGVAFTDLRPAGKVTINGKWVEARAAVGYITKSTKVKVVRIEGGVIFVETL